MTQALARILCLTATAGLLAAPGCNIVAPIAYLVHGPEKVKKVYTLDKNKTTVVLIDDLNNNVPRRALRVAIGEETEKTLLKQKTVKDMVSTQSAMAAAGTDKSGKPLSTAEVGAAVKSEIVIYATVDAFTLTPDGASLAPIAKVRVKVIDAAKDVRLWPEDPHGFPVTVRPNAKAKDLPSSTSSRYKIEDELAAQIGAEIAGLFYDHEAPKGLKAPE